MKAHLSSVLFLSLSLLLAQPAACETFTLPQGDGSVVGELRYVNVRSDETLIDIAREFDLGYDQIVKANPAINRWLPEDGVEVTLPQLYILPGTARRGLILNIAELRLYYFPSPKKGALPEVRTYPVSIGRMDWRTPLGATKVVAKEKDPAWRPPRSIREEHARDGDPLPEVIPGGHPENPLGRFALRLGIPTYLIHGVDERKAFGIGMRVTHGCVRMYPEDVEQLFELVSVNSPVLIVDQPIKIGRLGDRVFLSVNQPLDEGEDESLPPLPDIPTEQVVHHVRSQLGGQMELPLELIRRIAEQGDGIPHEIGRIASPPPKESYRSSSTVAATQYDSTDDAYYRGLAKHFATPPPFLDRNPTEAQRRAAVPGAGSPDDKAVRRYVEDRY